MLFSALFPQRTSAKQGVLGGRPSSGGFFEILNTPKIAQIYPMAPDEYLILVTDFSAKASGWQLHGTAPRSRKWSEVWGWLVVMG